MPLVEPRKYCNFESQIQDAESFGGAGLTRA
jgi:hypothetical protein